MVDEYGALRNLALPDQVRREAPLYAHDPVKRKLVAHPRGWPWSSFQIYASKEQGLVRTDPIN
jgi:hypothetical protein